MISVEILKVVVILLFIKPSLEWESLKSIEFELFGCSDEEGIPFLTNEKTIKWSFENCFMGVFTIQAVDDEKKTIPYLSCGDNGKVFFQPSEQDMLCSEELQKKWTVTCFKNGEGQIEYCSMKSFGENRFLSFSETTTISHLVDDKSEKTERFILVGNETYAKTQYLRSTNIKRRKKRKERKRKLRDNKNLRRSSDTSCGTGVPPGEWIQSSENDNARFVLMHMPSIEAFFGSLHPVGSLFASSFDLSQAQKQIRTFQEYLSRSLRISVFNVRDVLSTTPREELVELASIHLKNSFLEDYSCCGDEEKEARREEMEYYLSQKYKETTLNKLSTSSLIDIIFLRPVVHLEDSSKEQIDTVIRSVSTTVYPDSNLVFTRDQQITTKNGLVLGLPKGKKRREEIGILEIVWKQLGVKPIGKIPDNDDDDDDDEEVEEMMMYLEGGDFFPFSDDISMIGIGIRTNMAAVKYLMDNDLFGTDEVAVVVDVNDLSDERMHLDTVFNIVSDSVVVLLENIVDSVHPNDEYYRRVDIFSKRKEENYVFERSIGFVDYLLEKGMTIVPITELEQEEYMINFINLGRDHGIATVNPSLEIVLREALGYELFDELNIQVLYFEYDDVFAMHGALHCSTQVGRW